MLLFVFSHFSAFISALLVIKIYFIIVHIMWATGIRVRYESIQLKQMISCIFDLAREIWHFNSKYEIFFMSRISSVYTYVYICVYIHHNQTDYLMQKLIYKWRKIYKIPTSTFFINTVRKIINYKPYFRDVNKILLITKMKLLICIAESCIINIDIKIIFGIHIYG